VAEAKRLTEKRENSFSYASFERRAESITIPEKEFEQVNATCAESRAADMPLCRDTR
jgi:hypothetical protein